MVAIAIPSSATSEVGLEGEHSLGLLFALGKTSNVSSCI